MANICDNHIHIESDDKKNLEYVENFFDNEYRATTVCKIDNYVEADFESYWYFPEDAMNDLYDGLPNKNDIFMRCLSVEYGNLYHALWVCNSNGWHEV